MPTNKVTKNTSVGEKQVVPGNVAEFGWNTGDDSLVVNPDGTKRYVVTSAFGAFGPSAADVDMPATGGIALPVRVDAAGTTGTDTRAVYARVDFEGVGGGGEAVRAYATVQNVQAAIGGTVNGIHASLAINGASGAISGSGNAARCTLEVAAAATSVGGTVSVLLLDTFLASGAGLAGTASFIRVANSDTVKLNNLFNIESPSTGAGGMFIDNTDTPDKGLRILIDGTPHWIMVSQATA